MRSLGNCIEHQIEINTSKNLLCTSARQLIEIDPSFFAALERLLANTSPGSGEPIPPDIIALTVRAFLQKLYAVNQYVQVTRENMETLENIYRETWRVMRRTRNVQTTLREHHYPALSRWIADMYPEEMLKYLRRSPRIGHVVCAEYSAVLQLELFQIARFRMRQPILDIGCGSNANLVRYFRSQNLDAYGFDRFLETEAVYLKQRDWFEYDFEPDNWGTIISNMAFTNHLNYTYHHDRSQLEQYLRKLREIIESLTVGGSFYYAPSLPFIERLLPGTRYQVSSRQITATTSISVITRIAGECADI